MPISIVGEHASTFSGDIDAGPLKFSSSSMRLSPVTCAVCSPATRGISVLCTIRFTYLFARTSSADQWRSLPSRQPGQGVPSATHGMRTLQILQRNRPSSVKRSSSTQSAFTCNSNRVSRAPKSFTGTMSMGPRISRLTSAIMSSRVGVAPPMRRSNASNRRSTAGPRPPVFSGRQNP